MKKLNKKGFTLMEMLIVVAIIAILIAIAIPTFTKQLEKSRESTDAANLRSAYAEVVAEALGGTASSKTVTPTQKQDGWATTGLKVGELNVPSYTTATTAWTVSCGLDGSVKIS